MIKVRTLPESNYKAIFCNGKTIRMPLDPRAPVTELKFPEFYDVKITGKCEGKCSYCYQDSKVSDGHYDVDKCIEYFENMSKNERPFQVAIGGGNPNEHPDFCYLIEELSYLGITPNYTTNGMGLTKDVLDVTSRWCGGVAVTCHNHMTDIWEHAANLLHENKILLDFHILISDIKSVETFLEIFEKWKDKVEYFVMLPLISQGRAKDNYDENAIKAVINIVKNWAPADKKKVAFGANFYPYVKNVKELDLSLYEPEIFSGYLDISDMILYKSSFDLTPKFKETA